MATWKHFRDWLTYTYDLIYRKATSGVAAPDETKFYGVLTTGLTLTETQNIATVVSAEVNGNGYARQQITYPDTRAYDATDDRIESDFAQFTYSASGGDISWSGVAVIADATSWHRKTVSSINTTTNQLTVTAHGLSNGDAVAFKSTGAYPAPLAANTRYYASVIDANTITLYIDAALSSLVDLTNNGSGTFTLHNASGRIVCFANESAQLISDGTGQDLKIFVATKS